MLKRAGFQFEVDAADVAAIQQSGMRWDGLDPSFEMHSLSRRAQFYSREWVRWKIASTDVPAKMHNPAVGVELKNTILKISQTRETEQEEK